MSDNPLIQVVDLHKSFKMEGMELTVLKNISNEFASQVRTVEGLTRSSSPGSAGETQ